MMDLKVVMSQEKIKSYHDTNPPIYFRQCAICKDVQKIDYDMTNDTWQKVSILSISALKDMGNNITSSYCPKCEKIMEHRKQQMIEYLKNGVL